MNWETRKRNTLTLDFARIITTAICVMMLVGVIGITEKALVALIIGSMCEFKMTWER